MDKPYRFLIDRVAGYAEEGAAFLRRRRLRAREFARVWTEDGSIESREAEPDQAAELFEAATALIELAPPSKSVLKR